MASPLAAEFVARLSRGGPTPSLEIHPSDEMHRYGLDSLRGSEDAAAILYFEKGRQIADAYRAALEWRFGARGPASLLDFAAGFGRATRFLRLDWPSAEVFAAEIEAEAVAFQQRAFGVPGFVSAGEPGLFLPGRRFDAVLAASFFSHVPASAFEAWLRALWALVAPGGLLFLSTHGADLLTEPADWSRGFVFRAQSETLRLDPSAYGTSWATRSFVEGCVASATAGEAILHFVPFGLCAHQDVTLLTKPPAVPADPPALPLFARGDLDRFEVFPESLTAAGWVEASGDVDVAFFVGLEERARLSAGADTSADRRPWRFEIPLRHIGSDDVLRVAGNASGRWNTLAMGTLRGVGVTADAARL